MGWKSKPLLHPRVGGGPHDDTRELQVLIAVPGAAVTLDAGRTYRIKTVSFAAGVALTIPATTIVQLQDDGKAASTSLYVATAGVTITGAGTISGTSDLRTAVYGLVRAENATGLTVSSVTIHTSPSIGIWSLGGSGMRVTGVTVYDTGADGIQITRGANDFQVTGCTVHDTGDDGIACVGYIDLGYAQCSNGLFDSNTVTNVNVGRGIVASGGNTVTISNNNINGVDQAGILTAGGGGRSTNITIDTNTVNNSGRKKPAGGTGDLVYLTQTDTAVVKNCALTNTPYNGINFIDSLSTNLTDGGGNTFAGIGLQNVHHG